MSIKSKTLDLGYGNPSFLQELWQKHSISEIDSKKYMPYKFAKNIEPDLEQAILELHRKQGNIKVTDKTRAVVTVGAVQALQAGIDFFAQSYKKIYVPRPFWGRFEDFIKKSHLERIDVSSSEAFNLVTSPNNPEGRDQSLIKADVRDCCYNWSSYTKDVKLFNDPITLYSLSKLSGHSSSRIGWIITENPEIAEFCKNYVNIFTSGVSIEAQLLAGQIIKSLIDNQAFFDHAREILESRYLELAKIIEQKALPIKVISTQGMFWYVESNLDFIKQLNTSFVEGEYCFDYKANRFRFNLGVDTESYNEFKRRLGS